MNTHPRNLDIDAEIRALEQRKAKLTKLWHLRNEVSELEIAQMKGSNSNLTVKIVCDEVCRQFNLTMELLFSSARPENITMPRQIVFYLTRELAKVPYAQIGKAFRKDHGTIIHGHQRTQERMDTDARFKSVVENLRATCKAKLESSNEQPATN